MISAWAWQLTFNMTCIQRRTVEDSASLGALWQAWNTKHLHTDSILVIWSESSMGARDFVGLTHVTMLRFIIWTASSEFGSYRLCEQRRFRQACASAQSRQNLRCSLIQAVNQEEPSDRKPDPWPIWMAGHAQLKFVMTECSKTQIRLTRLRRKTCLRPLARVIIQLLTIEVSDMTWYPPENTNISIQCWISTSYPIPQWSTIVLL